MWELLIDSYKLKTLCELDEKNPRTIKNSPKYSQWYIAVKFDNWLAKQHYKAWTQWKPYSVRYVRLKDIKEYVEKKTWKKLVLIDKKDL